MGNQPSSSPCFEETLQWADHGHCSTMCSGVADDISKSSSMESSSGGAKNVDTSTNPKSSSTSDAQQEQRLAKTNKNIAKAMIPALTDCVSLSASSDERVEHPGLTRIANSTSSERESCGRSGVTRNNSDNNSVRSNFSMLWRHAVSGSFERDARIDLGTSRGSTGSRQGFDERDDKDLCPRE